MRLRLLLLPLIFALACGGSAEAPSEGAAGSEQRPGDERQEMATFRLYFPGISGRLHVEERDVPAHGDDTAGQIAEVVEALLAGPRSSSLRAPVADGVTLGATYLLGDGTVIIDLQTPQGEAPPSSGSSREMLTVFSLVNSVVLNFEPAERLLLTWNGSQPTTFAGHLDTSRPLAADVSLVAAAEGG